MPENRKGKALMTEHLPECADQTVMPHAIDCFCAVIRACEQRVISDAVQRVEAIPDAHWVNPNRIAAAGNKAQVIAAIKGDQT